MLALLWRRRLRRKRAAEIAQGRGRTARLSRRTPPKPRRRCGASLEHGAACSPLAAALEEAEGRTDDLPPGIAHAAAVQAQEQEHAYVASDRNAIDNYLPQQAPLHKKTARSIRPATYYLLPIAH